VKNPGAWRNLPGKSGGPYLYPHIDPNDPSPVWVTAGNFVLAKSRGNDMVIIYVGEAPNVYEAVMNTGLWDAAKLRYQTDLLLTHGQDDPLLRDLERRDLVDRWRPPMKWPDRT
jgi:hypothetical protein